MNEKALFGQTTTTVCCTTVQELANKAGKSANDFINTLAELCAVSVTLQSDEYFIKGTWDDIYKLQEKLLDIQHIQNKSGEKAAENGIDSVESRWQHTSGCAHKHDNEDSQSVAPDEERINDISPDRSNASSDNDNHENSSDEVHNQPPKKRRRAKRIQNYTEYNSDEGSGDEITTEEKADHYNADHDESDVDDTTVEHELNEMDLCFIDSLIEEVKPLTNDDLAAQFDSGDKAEKNTDDANASSMTYQCKKCVFASAERKCVEEHVKRMHIEKDPKMPENMCVVCNRCFRRKSDLIRHMAVHTKDNHICLRCGKVFKTSSALRAHIPTHKDNYVTQEFKCPTCAKVYSTKYVLANHIKTIHKGEAKKFQCNVCDKQFTQNGTMVMHKKVAHEGHKQYQCPNCSAEFGHSRLLKNHLRNVHKIPQNSKTAEKFKCDQCKFTTNLKEYLADHVRRSHKEKSLSCSVCDAKFSYASGLNKHMKLHRNQCECSVCNKVYKDPRSLERHIKTHDPNYVPEKVQCEICKRLLVNKYVLAIHQRREHGIGDQVIYSCDLCERTFKHKISLQEHKLMHKGERPWECQVCGHTFTYKTSLRSHMRRHAVECNFMCDVCGKSFKTKDTLRIHSVIHSDPDRYKCHCGKAFTQKQAMIRHQRTHSGEKPFLCHLCPEAFNDSSILRRHIMGVHKTPYEPKYRRIKPDKPQERFQETFESSKSNPQISEHTEALIDHADVSQYHTEHPLPHVSPDPSYMSSGPQKTPHALSLLAGLCAAADQVQNYVSEPNNVNRAAMHLFNETAYHSNSVNNSLNVMPPESPSMPALIPVTQPCSPPEPPQNLSTLVSTAFHDIQTSHTQVAYAGVTSHPITHPSFACHDDSAKTSW